MAHIGESWLTFDGLTQPANLTIRDTRHEEPTDARKAVPYRPF